jgi:hypothetical protein
MCYEALRIVLLRSDIHCDDFIHGFSNDMDHDKNNNAESEV